MARGHAALGDKNLTRAALTDATHELEQEDYKFLGFVPVFLGLVESAAGDRALLLRLNTLARSMEPAWYGRDLATCVGAVAGALARVGETAKAQDAVRWAIEAVQATQDNSAHGWVAVVALGRLAVVAGDLGLTDVLERLDAAPAGPAGLAGVAEGWARAGNPGRSEAAADRLAAPGLTSERKDDAIAQAAAAVELLEHPTLLNVRRALAAQMMARLVAGELEALGPAGYVIAACGVVGNANALARIEALVNDETNRLYGDLAQAYARLGDAFVVPDNRPLSDGCARSAVAAGHRRAVGGRWSPGPLRAGSGRIPMRARRGGTGAGPMRGAEDRMPFRQLLGLRCGKKG
jgi:hypothetical protein